MSKEQAKLMWFDDALAQEYADAERHQYLYREEDTGLLWRIEMAYGELLQREEAGGYLKISENSWARRALPEEFERDGLVPRSTSKIHQRPRWPKVEVNSGVNPSQRKELEDFWKSNDVTGCTVLPNGDIEYADRAARKRDYAARGLFDRSGGYGDQMPQNL